MEKSNRSAKRAISSQEKSYFFLLRSNVCSRIYKAFSSSVDLPKTSQRVAYDSLSHKVTAQVICTASCGGSGPQKVQPSLVFTTHGSSGVLFFIFCNMVDVFGNMFVPISILHLCVSKFFFTQKRQMNENCLRSR